MVQRNKLFDTILYTDGTLIICEDPAHHDANVAAHGAVVKKYNPKWYATYNGSKVNQPWYADNNSILNVNVDTEFKLKTGRNLFHNLKKHTGSLILF